MQLFPLVFCLGDQLVDLQVKVIISDPEILHVQRAAD